MADELLTFDMFSDKVEQAFVLDEPDAPPIEFKLIEVTPITNYAKAARAPFSLLFTTRGDLILAATAVSASQRDAWSIDDLRGADRQGGRHRDLSGHLQLKFARLRLVPRGLFHEGLARPGGGCRIRPAVMAQRRRRGRAAIP